MQADLAVLAAVVRGGTHGARAGELMTALHVRPRELAEWAERARAAGWPIERCGGGKRPVRYRMSMSDAYDVLHGFGVAPRVPRRGTRRAVVARLEAEGLDDLD